jgi:GTP pyrophosphokinase
VIGSANVVKKNHSATFCNFFLLTYHPFCQNLIDDDFMKEKIEPMEAPVSDTHPAPEAEPSAQVQALEAERKEILKRYRRLYNSIKPAFKVGDAKLIRKAFQVAADAHRHMRRKSGEPYIYHPIEVAQIAIDELSLGPTAIAAALLHDVVEDTEWTLEDVRRDFGEGVARIVDGVTKIPSSSDYKQAVSSSQQAENFRKMLLSLSDDVRVIMIKLADRLHNMRTLETMRRDKQLKIVAESMYVYAPLAHRLGLYKIKSELEDLYLKYTNEEAYRSIVDRLDRTKEQRQKFIQEFIAPLDTAIKKGGFKAKIIGRSKSVYSIYNKMRKQNVSFDEIYDLFAIRIILDSEGPQEKADCWTVYSIVTDHYHPNSQRLRDWISTPRANGYESLHTTVMGPEGKWVEVQIRTQRMDDIAEKGYAAHWKYKEKGVQSRKNRKGETEEAGLDAWLRIIRELREQNQELNAVDFINEFRANLYSEEVFVFTPKGDLKRLPIGATALDFAFEIHTEIGYQCLGAKVNQKLVPLNHKLNNGDQVEIITSRKQKPNRDWLKWVVSARAKAKIKDFLRHEMRDAIAEGKEIMARKLKQLDLEYSPELLNQIRTFFELKSTSDLFFNLGKGYLLPQQLSRFANWLNERNDKNAASPKAEAKPNAPNNPQQESSEEVKVFLSNKDTLLIGDQSQMPYSLARCCNPILGDEVFGFITLKDGVKIHRADCPNAPALLAKYGHRVIRARWQNLPDDKSFLVGLKIVGTDRVGLIRDLTKVISTKLKVNIDSLEVGRTDTGIFEGSIGLFVRDVNHLDNIRELLRRIDGVVSVDRVDTDE